MDALTATAETLVKKASNAIEARDASVLFSDTLKIDEILRDFGDLGEDTGIELDVDEGRLWTATRRLLGLCYLAGPARLRPDLQALLIRFVNQEGELSAVA